MRRPTPPKRRFWSKPLAGPAPALSSVIIASFQPIAVHRDAPIAREADHTLLFDTASNSFFHSTTGALALVECVLAAVSARGGSAVLRRLRERQRQLRISRAYWEAPRTRPTS